MMRKTFLAALSAALLTPAALAQDLPSGSVRGQTNPVIRGQAGAGEQTGTIGRPDPTPRTQVPARTQDPATTSRRSGVSDQLFATAAAAGGMAEVNLAQLGLKNATDPELKTFSQQMIDEHTKVNQELKALAGQKGVTLPTALDARAAFCSQSLAGLTGEEFDRCYAKAQLVTHMDAAAMFEAEAERGMDPEMKAFAAKTLPHIKEHLKTIKPIAMRYEKEMKDDQSPEHGANTGREAQSKTEGATPRGTTGGDTPKSNR